MPGVVAVSSPAGCCSLKSLLICLSMSRPAGGNVVVACVTIAAGLTTATTPGVLPYASQLKLFKFVPDEFVALAGLRHSVAPRQQS